MEWLFGKKVTPEELLRKNQRALNKAMRDLDREKMKMEQQEKKVINDIKKLAKEGQMVRQVEKSHCLQYFPYNIFAASSKERSTKNYISLKILSF